MADDERRTRTRRVTTAVSGRSTRTPEEEEAMIIVPLVSGDEVIAFPA